VRRHRRGRQRVERDADGDLVVAGKSLKGFEPLARYKVADSATMTHPAIVGRQILIKDEKSLSLLSIQ